MVHFAAVTDLDNPAVPPRLRRVAAGNTTGGGGWLVFRDGEFPRPGQSAAEDREQGEDLGGDRRGAVQGRNRRSLPGLSI